MKPDRECLIEVIARGVCLMDGQVLLCRNRTSALTYLPGGHVDFGESARQALVREILEEMGRAATAGRFLGCCEQSFMQKGTAHSEINLLFELTVEGISPSAPVVSMEDWITFDWYPLDRLSLASFQPARLIPLLPEWLTHPGGHVD